MKTAEKTALSKQLLASNGYALQAMQYITSGQGKG